jgi:hypothetical protein
MDQVGGALTFNPDPETPGWIVPVYPDELDHPERYVYVTKTPQTEEPECWLVAL